MLKVKNAFRFVQWQWRRMELIPKITTLSMLSVIMSLITMKLGIISDIFIVAALVGVSSTFVILFGTIIKEQYAKFKEDRQGLFDTIKHSDKQN